MDGGSIYGYAIYSLFIREYFFVFATENIGGFQLNFGFGGKPKAQYVGKKRAGVAQDRVVLGIARLKPFWDRRLAY